MQLSLLSPIDNLIAPPPPQDRVAFLLSQTYAHRGLHGSGFVENSRAAFHAAIAGGHGIELDVQASRDGESFVFHDAALDRLTETAGRLDQMLGVEIAATRLAGTNELIPRLSDILELVAGRVPILIEVKTSSVSVGLQCLAVRRALEGYRGNVGIMSFNPEVGRWFNDHAPRLPRGLVITEQGATALPDRSRQAITRRLSLWRAKPDFLAYDVRDFPSTFATAQRARGLPVLTWTVRTPQDQAKAAKHADGPIFERPQAAAP
jgi:glycerophosphoryl diester phosphodiesterase